MVKLASGGDEQCLAQCESFLGEPEKPPASKASVSGGGAGSGSQHRKSKPSGHCYSSEVTSGDKMIGFRRAPRIHVRQLIPP